MFDKREFDAIGIIPARLESTRLPKKLILDLAGKPVIAHIIENAKQSKHLRRIVVATDSQEIYDIARDYGVEAIITKGNFETGTDRIAWAYKHLDESADVVFNLQADEPLLKANLIDSLFEKFSTSLCQVGTLVKKINTIDELEDPSKVKVVLQNDSSALYFSRSPIPYNRDSEKQSWLESQVYWKHIGVYAYRDTALKAFSELGPTNLEITEKLEQLRLLQNNYKYFCMETDQELYGIDTKDDLELIEKMLK